MSDELKFHPLADIFPLMEGEEFDALVADIKANRLRDKIILYEGRILDGRNRYRALRVLGADLGAIRDQCCVTRDCIHHHGGPAAYVISANIHRRHLTAEQKRDLIAKLIKAQPEKSNRQIAVTAKVDHKTVGAARAELEATGKIPQLEKTTGKDGKARKRPTKKNSAASRARQKTKAAFAADDDDPGDFTPEELPPDTKHVMWRRGLLFRAREAAGDAAYEDWSEFTVDQEIIDAVKQAADAWTNLLRHLEHLPNPESVVGETECGIGVAVEPDQIERQLKSIAEGAGTSADDPEASAETMKAKFAADDGIPECLRRAPKATA